MAGRTNGTAIPGWIGSPGDAIADRVNRSFLILDIEGNPRCALDPVPRLDYRHSAHDANERVAHLELGSLG
jgi:hypothetical protein